MAGLARKGKIEMDCLFCGKAKAKVKVFHKEGYMQARASRISAGTKVTRRTIPDYYEILKTATIAARRRKTYRPLSREDIGEKLTTKNASKCSRKGDCLWFWGVDNQN